MLLKYIFYPKFRFNGCFERNRSKNRFTINYFYAIKFSVGEKIWISRDTIILQNSRVKEWEI
jgi:hypothetical protein